MANGSSSSPPSKQVGKKRFSTLKRIVVVAGVLCLLVCVLGWWFWPRIHCLNVTKELGPIDLGTREAQVFNLLFDPDQPVAFSVEFRKGRRGDLSPPEAEKAITGEIRSSAAAITYPSG